VEAMETVAIGTRAHAAIKYGRFNAAKTQSYEPDISELLLLKGLPTEIQSELLESGIFKIN
jgi:hypothetical protein